LPPEGRLIVADHLEHLRSAIAIDDDPLQRKVALAALRDIGFTELFEAADGVQALATMAAPGRNIDFALCDLDMAGMDGIQLLSRLARERPGMPVVLLSSQQESLISAVGTMAAASGLNVVGTMQKPLHRIKLREFVLALDQSVRSVLQVPSSDAMSADEVQKGLTAHQFVAYFQPKIDLHTGVLIGAEALARWQHPQLGVLSPARFIATAESSGLIGELTWQILDHSMLALSSWIAQNMDLKVSVNLTVGFLERDAIADEILALAERYKVPPSSIMLELTESMAASDVGAMVGNLARLRMRGFGLSIDDFGTGYSSLQQLSRVPFSELKVDRSFVSGASTQPHLRAILESSVQLGKRLGLVTTAEGVETGEELSLVRAIGCDIAQGYYFARPMTAADFSLWALKWAKEHQLPALESTPAPGAVLP
jgi:EAL domain-containing protein (putative c-di-GMP-specific phosphodiesterase class I)/DNA-binding NarL/FixJ family response regulator